jgi:hypothetical protein
MSPGHSIVLGTSSHPGPPSAYRYFVYGITLHSEIPLALPEQGHGDLGQIELRIAPTSCFSEAARSLPLRSTRRDSCETAQPMSAGRGWESF